MILTDTCLIGFLQTWLNVTGIFFPECTIPENRQGDAAEVNERCTLL